MGINLEKVNVAQGESLIITFGGSAEVAVVVRMNESGSVRMTGPMNVNGKTFKVSESGIEEMPSPGKGDGERKRS